MGLSLLLTKRFLAAYRSDGPAALAHGNRGRRPHSAVPEAVESAVVKLAGKHYTSANHTHLTELPREREGIGLSRPTVRGILTSASMVSRRAVPVPAAPRAPLWHMLVQADGSNHRRLKERGPKLVLLTVDDSTSAVAQSIVRTTEYAQAAWYSLRA